MTYTILKVTFRGNAPDAEAEQICDRAFANIAVEARQIAAKLSSHYGYEVTAEVEQE